MKKALSLVLVLAMVFALSVLAFAAAAPVPGNPSPKMDWNPAYAAKALTVTPYSYDRENASGDKITSNAHSADFKGLYFYWNDKQKNDGVLLVDPFVFTLFVDETFTVTAKTSNCYWGHDLTADPAAYDADSGLYIFNILRNCMFKDKKGNLVGDELKNINMIFIDGNYKSAEVEVEKFVDAEQVDEWAFAKGKIGTNIITFKSYPEAIKGKTFTASEIILDGADIGFAKVEVNGVEVAAKVTDVTKEVGLVTEKIGEEFAASILVKPGDTDGVISFYNEDGGIVIDDPLFTLEVYHIARDLAIGVETVLYTDGNNNNLYMPGYGEYFYTQKNAAGKVDLIDVYGNVIEWLNGKAPYTILTLPGAGVRPNLPAAPNWDEYGCSDISWLALDGDFDVNVFLADGMSYDNDATATIVPKEDGRYVLIFWYDYGTIINSSYYYAACQLYHDILYGFNNSSLDASYYNGLVPFGGVDNWAGDILHPVGLAHRDAIQMLVFGYTFEADWRYEPLSLTDEDADQLRTDWETNITNALREVCDELGIDVDAFFAAYGEDSIAVQAKYHAGS